MEDLFNVSSCAGTSTDVTSPSRPATVCGGLDGQGHIGYAAQTGLEPFGTDVFTAPGGNGFMPPIHHPDALPEAPLVVVFPAIGLFLLGGFWVVRRRRDRVIIQ